MSALDIIYTVFRMVVFPGIIFLFAYSLFCEWLDRKLYARMQNRRGPMHTGWFGILQPFADFIKLMAKEDISPEGTDHRVLAAAPIVALAAAMTAFMYIPVSGGRSIYPFQGDLVIVLYLLTIPTVALFVVGWYSKNLFGAQGAVRCLTQLFSYEIPLLLVMLAPAMLAGSWSIADIVAYQVANPYAFFVLIPGFAVALVALQGKLERIPFDLPEAETEIVAGPLVEITGRKLAIFRLVFDIEMVVVAALMSAIFLGASASRWGIPGFAFFLASTLIIVFILAVMRTLFARVRIDQMTDFCWKYLAPLALLQILLVVLLKAYAGSMGWGWI